MINDSICSLPSDFSTTHNNGGVFGEEISVLATMRSLLRRKNVREFYFLETMSYKFAIILSALEQQLQQIAARFETELWKLKF